MEEYRYSIFFSNEDECFIAQSSDYPSVSAHGVTKEEAVEELKFVLDCITSDPKEKE
jgi:predicted RNase H-like HicB family nuclease